MGSVRIHAGVTAIILPRNYFVFWLGFFLLLPSISPRGCLSSLSCFLFCFMVDLALVTSNFLIP